MRRVHRSETTVFDGEWVHVGGVLYSGEVVDTAHDGTVISLHTYLDGREHGPQREFHYDGSPSSAYTAVRGEPVGEAWEWFDDGEPARLRVFSDSGQLLTDKTFDDVEPDDSP